MALREPTIFIMTSLANGRLHGYGILASVKELSEGRIALSTGTLYGALDRLERDGLVAFAGTESDGGPPRRYFELTNEGRAVLADEIARLRQTAITLGDAIDGAWA